MACTHAAGVLATFAGGHGPDRNVAAKTSAAGKLLRAYATQIETLRRLRNGGSQIVRVEHVHVNEGEERNGTEIAIACTGFVVATSAQAQEFCLTRRSYLDCDLFVVSADRLRGSSDCRLSWHRQPRSIPAMVHCFVGCAPGGGG
jgi:hypothetical protein